MLSERLDQMLKQTVEVMVQRACHRLITAVATAAVSVHSPLYFVLLGVVWLGSAGGSGASSGWCWMHPSWAVRRDGQHIPMQPSWSQPTASKTAGHDSMYMLLLTNRTLCLGVMNDTDDWWVITDNHMNICLFWYTEWLIAVIGIFTLLSNT